MRVNSVLLLLFFSPAKLRKYFEWAKGKGLFVLNEVQALIAVEGELGVIGDERDAIADGLRNDQVVTGVIVLLGLIDLQSGILLVMLLVEVEDSEITLGERFSRSFAYHT